MQHCIPLSGTCAQTTSDTSCPYSHVLHHDGRDVAAFVEAAATRLADQGATAHVAYVTGVSPVIIIIVIIISAIERHGGRCTLPIS